MKEIVIHSRLGEVIAVTDGRVAAFDHPDWATGLPVRNYVLLEESVKLMYEPWGWREQWYVDLVSVTWKDENMLELRDLYLDIIVEENGPTYRMIDFNDLADALSSGQIDATTLHEPLHRLQQFLDNHLHGDKDFPPACIAAFQP